MTEKDLKGYERKDLPTYGTRQYENIRYTKNGFYISVVRILRRSGKLVTKYFARSPTDYVQFPSLKKAVEWVENEMESLTLDAAERIVREDEFNSFTIEDWVFSFEKPKGNLVTTTMKYLRNKASGIGYAINLR